MIFARRNRTCHLRNPDRKRKYEIEIENKKRPSPKAPEKQHNESAKDPVSDEQQQSLFDRAFSNWPTAVSEVRPKALKEWQKLAGDEQEAAARMCEAYVAEVEKTGRYLCGFEKYLREKRWMQVPRGTSGAVAGSDRPIAEPFDALFLIERFRLLSDGPQSDRLHLTQTEEQLITSGKRTHEDLMAGKRRNSGFPSINYMDQRAINERGVVSVSRHLLPMTGYIERVEVGSETWHAWAEEHEKRGWPWFPQSGIGYAVTWLPAGGPKKLDNFLARLLELHDAENVGNST